MAAPGRAGVEARAIDAPARPGDWIETSYLRARSAIAVAAADAAARRRSLSIARTYANRLAQEGMPWSDPMSRLITAAIASVDGRHDDALRDLHDAADGFERADMTLYLAVTRRRIGQLRPDDVGSACLRDSDRWMANQGVKNPAALSRMIAPGFPGQ